MKEQTIVRLLDLVNRFLNGEKLSTKEIGKKAWKNFKNYKNIVFN